MRHRCPHCNLLRVHPIVQENSKLRTCQCIGCGMLFQRTLGGYAKHWRGGPAGHQRKPHPLTKPSPRLDNGG